MLVPLTPIEFKRRAVQLYGSKIGVIDGERRFTYVEFGDRCDRLSAALLARNLQRGDRVAYLAYNSHPLLEGYFGVLQAGGVLLPINIRLSPDEIAVILNHATVSYLLADADFLHVIEAVWNKLEKKPLLIWLTSRPEGRDEEVYDEVLGGSKSRAETAIGRPFTSQPPIDENDVAELFYTSGTTGNPKGVMLTHRNLYLHALSTLIALETKESDVQLHTIPLFHVNGWGTPQYLTAAGGTHVMLRKFDPAEAMRLIQKERVTRFLVVPTMLNMILNHPDLQNYDLSSLRLINTGGAPTPPEMLRTAQGVLDCKVIGGYGLSETSPVITLANDKSYLPPDEYDIVTRRASTGLPVIGVDLRIVGEDDEDLPWDGETVGEIAVRGNVVMKGYLDDDDATESAIRDGWFYTGDLAVVNPEGYVLIVDRKKDIIVSGGENISSVEIERRLYEHPAVLESAVISAPDDRWGEVPVALIVLLPGTAATEEELKAFCRETLAPFKVPRQIQLVDSLPKGGTGKILKRQLRESLWREEAKRVH